MKLVEILARELEVWPECTEVVGQASDGTIHLCGSFEKNMNGHSDETYTLASDWNDVDVTRAQWEAERARIASEVKVGTLQVEIDDSGWSAECQKQYEQELWDKVALDMYKHYRGMRDLHEDAMGYAFFDADAFMAERAKRIMEKQCT